MGGVFRQQPSNLTEASTENRTPSRPVPVKGAKRNSSEASYQEPEHLGLWRDHDDSDAQYLKRLYELRTWDMWVRITEARKRQRTVGNTVEKTGEGPPMLAMELRPGQTPPTPTDVSENEEMIFSCDFE